MSTLDISGIGFEAEKSACRSGSGAGGVEKRFIPFLLET